MLCVINDPPLKLQAAVNPQRLPPAGPPGPVVPRSRLRCAGRSAAPLQPQLFGDDVEPAAAVHLPPADRGPWAAAASSSSGISQAAATMGSTVSWGMAPWLPRPCKMQWKVCVFVFKQSSFREVVLEPPWARALSIPRGPRAVKRGLSLRSWQFLRVFVGLGAVFQRR